MFCVFLSRYRNTCGSLGELETSMETLACRLVLPQHFSSSQMSTRIPIETWHMFSICNKCQVSPLVNVKFIYLNLEGLYYYIIICITGYCFDYFCPDFTLEYQ